MGIECVVVGFRFWLQSPRKAAVRCHLGKDLKVSELTGAMLEPCVDGSEVLKDSVALPLTLMKINSLE